MREVVGFHSACELVRRRAPYRAAVEVLVAELKITHAQAVAAMTAAHAWIEPDVYETARLRAG